MVGGFINCDDCKTLLLRGFVSSLVVESLFVLCIFRKLGLF